MVTIFLIEKHIKKNRYSRTFEKLSSFLMQVQFEHVRKWDTERKFNEQCKIHGNHCLSILWEV